MKELPTIWEEICKVNGTDPAYNPIDAALPGGMRDFLYNTYRAAMVLEVLNEGWEPSWLDLNDHKYSIFFYMFPDADSLGGVSFSFYVYAHGHPDTAVSSRLLVRDPEIGKHAATHFKDIFRAIILIDKL